MCMHVGSPKLLRKVCEETSELAAYPKYVCWKEKATRHWLLLLWLSFTIQIIFIFTCTPFMVLNQVFTKQIEVGAIKKLCHGRPWMPQVAVQIGQNKLDQVDRSAKNPNRLPKVQQEKTDYIGYAILLWLIYSHKGWIEILLSGS